MLFALPVGQALAHGQGMLRPWRAVLRRGRKNFSDLTNFSLLPSSNFNTSCGVIHSFWSGQVQRLPSRVTRRSASCVPRAAAGPELKEVPDVE